MFSSFRVRNLMPSLLATVFSFISSIVLASDVKPNIILILTDDQGIGDVAAYGSDDIVTPHMDRLGRKRNPF